MALLYNSFGQKGRYVALLYNSLGQKGSDVALETVRVRKGRDVAFI